MSQRSSGNSAKPSNKGLLRIHRCIQGCISRIKKQVGHKEPGDLQADGADAGRDRKHQNDGDADQRRSDPDPWQKFLMVFESRFIDDKTEESVVDRIPDP